MVTDHDSNRIFTIQLGSYIFLAQNCIKLELDPFRARLLNYRSQILRPCTTHLITEITDNGLI